MPKLTVAVVRAAKHSGKPTSTGKLRPERLPDGGGLALQVTPDGAKSWILRYTRSSKAREMGLGPCDPDGRRGLSLADARDAAEAARRTLRAGADPIEAREAERAARQRAEAEAKAAAVTFRDAARATVDAKQGGWSSPKHAAQWLATLEQHAHPILGDMPVSDVGTPHVLQVLRPIWSQIPETASRLRQRIEAILDLARVRGWRAGDNPARWRGLLSEELPPPRRVKRVQHRPALPWQRLPAFMAALAQVEGQGAAALRFAILTAARTGEVRGATWGEVDLDAALWIVPGARMKGRRTHRVPLSAAAVDVLRAARPADPKRADLIFGATATRAISDMTLSAVVRRMNEPGPGADPDAPPEWCDQEGRAVVPHGFRSTFRDWAGEIRPEGREVVERALAHSVRDKVEAAYARSDLLEKRRPLMEAWGEWAGRPAGGGELRSIVAARARRQALG
ncbi:integrase arm-type DNA-binding domain-containing protein [Roseomonas frigidaquae]|uniref:Integrase arm-type DNA-binding domain-containing protein n=1 Tax=Falsiroseomonas frigidaquae TaxID=487318 RepID=A0ABX1F3U7_9PROT|nr:site-specific integrase [Falsiroseomonas frigidaquae]NKE47025.1 integrase arm-type DNA-binding domain-containing protein [Falsiroseomonas frigidaquae]